MQYRAQCRARKGTLHIAHCIALRCYGGRRGGDTCPSRAAAGASINPSGQFVIIFITIIIVFVVAIIVIDM